MQKQSLDQHLFVIMGGTGDLALRKLIPSLFRVAREQNNLKSFRVLGVAPNDELDDASYRSFILDQLEEHSSLYEETEPGQVRDWIQSWFHFQSIGDGAPAEYDRLHERIDALEQDTGLPGNRVFYLALPHHVFETAITGLGQSGLNNGPGWTRLVIEKPFGNDTSSARALNEHVHNYFAEEQVYRIDHYLGKETVQNLMIFRFANPIFETQWNRERIDSVQITVAEGLGVGDRAGYYDEAGAVRDMMQNHLTQIFSLVAMEEPARFEPEEVRNEKVKVLKTVSDYDLNEDVVLGQYEAGSVDGESVPGYLDEPDVPDDSTTETFAAARLHLENWRWKGVPFYLCTGKRLPAKSTRIEIRFQEPPVCFFESFGSCQVTANKLVLTLQPDEGFELYFEVKKPGEPLTLQSYPLDFEYGEVFEPIPDAYSTLLHDIMQGDQTLFVRSDEVEAAWSLYEPILQADVPVHAYEAGSRGPAPALKMLPF